MSNVIHLFNIHLLFAHITYYHSKINCFLFQEANKARLSPGLAQHCRGEGDTGRGHRGLARVAFARSGEGGPRPRCSWPKPALASNRLVKILKKKGKRKRFWTIISLIIHQNAGLYLKLSVYLKFQVFI